MHHLYEESRLIYPHMMLAPGSKIYFGILSGTVVLSTDNHAIVRFDDGKIRHITRDDLEGTEVI